MKNTAKDLEKLVRDYTRDLELKLKLNGHTGRSNKKVKGSDPARSDKLL